MQSAARLVSTLYLGILSYAQGNVPKTNLEVEVFVSSDLGALKHPGLRGGMALASSMFARVGVQIRWKSGHPNRDAKARPICIQIQTNAPHSAPPDRLALSKPFGGDEIVIFWNRLELAACHGRLSALLGHVLVHEIMHILKATDGHTTEGIMKAHWTDEDIWRMSNHPLSFDSRDIELIVRSLRSRLKSR